MPGATQRVNIASMFVSFRDEPGPAPTSATIHRTRQHSSREFAADFCVHVFGTLLGAIGATMLAVRVATDAAAHAVPVLIYAVSLLTMLGCSSAYNLSAGTRRHGFLRRADHAAIFLLIAGTYTPFTTRLHDGATSIALTSLIWTVALAGATAKLVVPHRFERLSTVVYLALGWTILAAFGPITATLDALTIGLLVGGGILYSVGVAFYLWRALPFQTAIWHVFVLAAAGCHYAAILHSFA